MPSKTEAPRQTDREMKKVAFVIQPATSPSRLTSIKTRLQPQIRADNNNNNNNNSLE